MIDLVRRYTPIQGGPINFCKGRIDHSLFSLDNLVSIGFCVDDLASGRLDYKVARLTEMDAASPIHSEADPARISAPLYDPVVLEPAFVSVDFEIDTLIQLLVKNRSGCLDPCVPSGFVFALEVIDCVICPIYRHDFCLLGSLKMKSGYDTRSIPGLDVEHESRVSTP